MSSLGGASLGVVEHGGDGGPRRGAEVRARPATWRYRVNRFVSRNRWAVVTGSVASLALIVATVVSLFQMREAVRARNVADRERAIAVGEALRARLTAAQAAFHTGDPIAARRLLEAIPDADRDWEWSHLFGRLDQAAAIVDAPDSVAIALDEDRPTFITVSANGAVRWWNPFLSTVEERAQLDIDSIDTAVFSQDGSHVAAADSGRPSC